MTDLRAFTRGRVTPAGLPADTVEALRTEALADGDVSAVEASDLRNVLIETPSAFDATQRQGVLALSAEEKPVATPGPAIRLEGSRRFFGGVFVNPAGELTLRKNGKPPENVFQLGSVLYRAGELLAGTDSNAIRDANLPLEVRQGILRFVQLGLVQVPALGPPPDGMDLTQAAQVRASSFTVLLALLESTDEPALQEHIARTIEALVVSEPPSAFRSLAILQLWSSPSSDLPAVRQVSELLAHELPPSKPPYEKWFANGNKTIRARLSAGAGEGFQAGIARKLKEAGFVPLGPEVPGAETEYELKMNRPEVGETVFRVTLLTGDNEHIFDKVGAPEYQIVGFDGHADWGRSHLRSLRNAPKGTQGEDQIYFGNMCVGKNQLDGIREMFPKLQIVTTYASALYTSDPMGEMTDAEGVHAFLAMINGIGSRLSWLDLHRDINRAADFEQRTWDNYVTPVSTVVRERVTDSDGDGHSNYFDRHFNFSTFSVAEDTVRELMPVRQRSRVRKFSGTGVLDAAEMVNTLSEYSEVLRPHNPDSRVSADGYFKPGVRETTLVAFELYEDPEDWSSRWKMRVNSRYVHMGEETMRAVSVLEFNRMLMETGKLELGPIEAKLHGILAVGQSVLADNGYREAEVWKAVLERYNLPPIPFEMVTGLLREGHGRYVISVDKIDRLRAMLPPEMVAALAEPAAGEPVRVIVGVDP